VLKIKGKHYQVTHAEKAKPKVKFTPGKVDLAKMNEMALKKSEAHAREGREEHGGGAARHGAGHQ